MSCRMYKTEYEKCAVAHAHKIFFINPAVLEESELTFYKVWSRICINIKYLNAKYLCFTFT